MAENLPTIITNAEVSPLAEEYAILDPAAAQEVKAIIDGNLGPRGVREGDMDRIKAPTGGQLSYEVQEVEGPESRRELRLIIAGWSDGRMLFKTAYGAAGKQKAPPDCISRDGFVGIGDPGGNCVDCPYAEWGTDPKGGRGQACKEIRRLLVLRAGNILPEIVNVPPTSLKNVRDYFKRLSSRRIPFWGLVTILRLERAENADGVAYARMTFSAGPHLSQADGAALAPFQGQMEQLLHNAAIDSTDYEAAGAPPEDFTSPRGEGFASPIDD